MVLIQPVCGVDQVPLTASAAPVGSTAFNGARYWRVSRHRSAVLDVDQVPVLLAGTVPRYRLCPSDSGSRRADAYLRASRVPLPHESNAQDLWISPTRYDQSPSRPAVEREEAAAA
jgi:hypothetical protein